MVASPMSSIAVENVALPGLGPPPPEPVARSRDPEGALRELFGFPTFRPGQREAVEAAVAGRDVLVVMPTGLGQVALLPAAGADARGPDGRGLAAGVADAGPGARRSSAIAPGVVGLVNAQQDAAVNRRMLDRAAPGSCALLYVAPERFSSPGLPGARSSARGSGCSWSTRRTACRSGGTTSGRTTSALARRRALARRGRDRRARRRPRRRRCAADIVARLGLRDPRARGDGLRSPEPLVRGRAVREQGRRPPRRSPPRWPSRARCRASSTRARARRRAARDRLADARRARRSPTTPACRATRGAEAQRRVHGRRGAGGRRHQRVRDGHRQGRRAHRRATRASRARSRRTTRRPAARAATGSRRAACCSPRARTRACTSSSSSARRSPTTR